MVRIDVYATEGRCICEAFCDVSASRVRVDEGRRNEGGKRPQLRGVAGGMVDMAAATMRRFARLLVNNDFRDGARATHSRDELFTQCAYLARPDASQKYSRYADS